MIRTTTSLLLTVLLLSGCARDKFKGRPDLSFVANADLPKPLPRDLGTATTAFVIGPADKLAIDTLGMDERPREIEVDPSGNISVPLAGSIHAAGLTSAQLAALISSRLKAAYVRNPVVTVNLTEVVSQAFTVAGEVTKPGIYPVLGRTTLIGALARAEGTTEYARENYVVVFRTTQGRRFATLFDLRAIREGLYADPDIYANDEVIVGASSARRLFKDVLSAAPLLTTPIIAATR